MNYTALTQQPTKAQLAQFDRRYPASQTTVGRRKLVTIVLGIVGGFFLIGGIQSLITALTTDKTLLGGSLFTLFFAIVLLGTILLFAYGVKKQRSISAQIALFAEANGFTFAQKVDDPTLTGMYFGVGYRRALNNVISANRATPKFQIGNLQYTLRTGRTETTFRKGYIRIMLERNLPHIVLDASSNNMKVFGKNITNLPEDFDTSQRMSLEGDFDTYFTLYAPKEYERDALYIFTPDLMALMIDNAKAFDAEIIDNQLFIYQSQMPFTLTDPALMDRLFKIIEVVGNKADTQTNFYADEKVGDRTANEVAAGGRRLRKGVSVITIFVIVIVIAILTAQVVFTILPQ